MRGGHQMCIDSDEGSIYLFGGWNGRNDLGDFWKYDIKNNLWTLLSSNTKDDGFSLPFPLPFFFFLFLFPSFPSLPPLPNSLISSFFSSPCLIYPGRFLPLPFPISHGIPSCTFVYHPEIV